MAEPPGALLREFAAVVGARHVLTGDATAGYATDWTGGFTGRAAHQAPEVDSITMVSAKAPLAVGDRVPLVAGDMVRAVVTGSDGVDLTADVIPPSRR